MANKMENNKAVITGKIVSKFTFNHEAYGEGFYTVNIEVVRLSGTCDVIPVLVSERLIDVKEDCQGSYVSILGQYRSYNRHDEQKSRLLLYVFAHEISFITEPERSLHINQVYLKGYVCRKPMYRKTPLGREVTDVLLVVNRPYGKTDYIPCICWGRDARYADRFEAGTHCAVKGRIQSREYMKKISDEQLEKRVAYEVSVGVLEMLDEPEMSKDTPSEAAC